MRTAPFILLDVRRSFAVGRSSRGFRPTFPIGKRWELTIEVNRRMLPSSNDGSENGHMMKLLRRMTVWMRSRQHGADLADELEHHRAAAQTAFESRGLSPADASAASRRAMGNTTLAREEARDV